MKGTKKFSEGFTLVELLMTSAIVALAVSLFFQPLRIFLLGTAASNLRSRALDELRPVDMFLERDLTEMVELRLARADRIEFVLDSNRLPTYDPSASHFIDPDDDGDADLWAPPSQWWARGNDLDDDDDDGDGKLDAWMAYSFVGDALIRETSYNEGPIQHQTIANHLSEGSFSYFGSIKRRRGTDMDTDLDGIVTAAEIDSLPPPLGVGDSSGDLNTPQELREVVYIHIHVRNDLNGDGTSERTLDKDVTPPLLNFRTPRL